MGRIISILKKGTVAGLLAAAAFLVFGFNSGTVRAVAMSTGTHVFSDPGIDVFGDGRHATYTVKFADGNNAYCIEYAREINDLSSYTPTDNPYVNLDERQKTRLMYALIYGYTPSSAVLGSTKDISDYVMTQTMVWCITEGYLDDPSVRNGACDRVAQSVCSTYPGADISYMKTYFNTLYDNIMLAERKTVPAFFSNAQDADNIIMLRWNNGNKRYEAGFTDKNGVLDCFDLSVLKSAGIEYSVSGDNITFYREEPLDGPVLQLTVRPFEGTYASGHKKASLIYWGNALRDQTVVTCAAPTPDEICAYAGFKTEKTRLELRKVSSDDGEGLNGAVFDIYSDKKCTKLIKTVTTVDKDGVSGRAAADGLDVGKTYYVIERRSPVNYRPLEDIISFTVKSKDNYIEIKNDRIPVKVKIKKIDEEDRRGIAGAIYSLYAREDIMAASGSRIIYKAGSWITDFPSTDEAGEAFIDNLYIGKYYIKEKSAPESGIYELDEKEYDADAENYKSENMPYIEVDLEVKEKRSPGYLRVIKKDALTGDALAGARFGIYSDGKCEKLLQTITSGSDGITVSDKLPEGTYYVKELKAPSGYVKKLRVYECKVNPAGVTDIEISDMPVRVLISKVSAGKSGSNIPGAELVLRDMTGNEICRWVTDTKPHLIERLPEGRYILTETAAPFGYQIAENIEFTVTALEDIQKIEMKDNETYGRIMINKKDRETGSPIKNAVFEIRVAKDVFNSEGNIEIKAGTAAAVLVTDEHGIARSDLLPIGIYGVNGWISYIEYELVETRAADGYKLPDEKYPLEFIYIDENTPVVENTFNLTNERITVEKQPVTGDSFTDIIIWLGLFTCSAVTGMLVLRNKKRKLKFPQKSC